MLSQSEIPGGTSWLISEPKGHPDKVSASDASAILDKAFGGKAKQR
ncbi:hypothetical protein G6L32_14655 [Agrobacterium tumefaciens]|nr:hypothetical protein [Agrobacterium tumefaciens]